MDYPKLNLQSFDEQHTPSQTSHGYMENLVRINDSDILDRNDLQALQSFHTEDEGEGDDKPSNRKIMYRVGKKIYTPEEIMLIREYILVKSKRNLKK